MKISKNVKDDIKFLLSFLPEWVLNVEKNLDPTFYGTLTYDGDIKVKNHIDKIKEKYEL